jgi:hypothetical protein
MFSAKYQSYDILAAMKTQVVLSFLNFFQKNEIFFKTLLTTPIFYAIILGNKEKYPLPPSRKSVLGQ